MKKWLVVLLAFLILGCTNMQQIADLNKQNLKVLEITNQIERESQRKELIADRLARLEQRLKDTEHVLAELDNRLEEEKDKLVQLVE